MNDVDKDPCPPCHRSEFEKIGLFFYLFSNAEEWINDYLNTNGDSCHDRILELSFKKIELSTGQEQRAKQNETRSGSSSCVAGYWISRIAETRLPMRSGASTNNNCTVLSHVSTVERSS
jgi:hypothetical protein